MAMKFSFKNVGFLDSGSIELSDLTLICGSNNTGKTYVSYSIYGIIKHFKRLIDILVTENHIIKLKNDGTISIDLNEYAENIHLYFSKVSKEFSKTLYEYFNAPKDFFSNASVTLSEDGFSLDLTKPFKAMVNFGNVETLIFDKDASETILNIAFKNSTETKLPNRILERVISEEVADCLFGRLFPDPFVITSERTGISLFYKELDINKNAIVEHLTKDNEVDIVSMLNTMNSRYAYPIHDNINIIRDYEKHAKKKSFLLEEKETYKHIITSLKEVIGGSFKVNKDKQLMYYPRKEKGRSNVEVPVYIASSSIKSLFMIDLYINHLAQKKGLLIIDEPELNLHPDNQIKMAGLITRLVNAGVKVMVTTHSDFLVREISNRIMLNNDFPEKDKIMHDYKLIEEDCLSPKRVKAFITTKQHDIEEVEVDKWGVNMKKFDDVITKANGFSETLYQAVSENE